MENLLNDIHKLNELITNSKGIQKSNAYISKKKNIGTAVYNKNNKLRKSKLIYCINRKYLMRLFVMNSTNSIELTYQ